MATDAPGSEKRDAAIGPVTLAGALVAAMVLAAFCSMLILFKILNYYQSHLDESPHPLADTRAVNPGPRLQVDPPQQKFESRQIEENLLRTYGWVDQEKGVARIPIKRAMALVAQKKLQLQTGSAASGGQKSSGTRQQSKKKKKRFKFK